MWYKDLARWDIGSFSTLSWAWPPDIMQPLGSVLRRVIREVDTSDLRSIPIIEKITFGGVASVLPVDDREGYKGRLFWAEPGQFVYSRIRAKQGSFTVVDPAVGRLAVSQEYPVYDIARDRIDPEFLKLALRSQAFLSFMAGLSHGGSTKTRMLPDQFESLKIPVPPLAVQRRIVAAATKARDQAARLRAEADEREAAIGVEVLNRLGLEAPRVPTENQRWFIAKWSDITAWGVRATVRQMRTPDLALGKYPVATGHDCFADIRHGCSLSPSDRDTSLRILKISAVTRGHLRTSEFKHIKDSPRLRKEFEIRAGDLLCCRTNGTLAYVGTPALVESDLDDVIFPDKVIRVRCKDSVLPAYVWLVMKTPHIRGQIEAAARTAVGNYAIGTEDLWAMRLPLPPRGVQAEIVTFAGREQGAVDRLRQKADGVETVASAATERMILGTDLP